MPFTDKTAILTAITVKELAALTADDDNIFNDTVAQVDEIIQGKTNVEVPEEPALGKKIFTWIANALVIHTLSNRQSSVSEENRKKREFAFDQATKLLDDFAGGKIRVGEPIDPREYHARRHREFHSTRRNLEYLE